MGFPHSSIKDAQEITMAQTIMVKFASSIFRKVRKCTPAVLGDGYTLVPLNEIDRGSEEEQQVSRTDGKFRLGNAE